MLGMAKTKSGILRTKRTERGWTLAEAAETLGVTVSWLSRVERGHFDAMPLDQAFRFQRVYGIPVEHWAPKQRRTA